MISGLEYRAINSRFDSYFKRYRERERESRSTLTERFEKVSLTEIEK